MGVVRQEEQVMRPRFPITPLDQPPLPIPRIATPSFRNHQSTRANGTCGNRDYPYNKKGTRNACREAYLNSGNVSNH